jgi:ubiquinol-cytochrome c reductase cytochrome c subunit
LWRFGPLLAVGSTVVFALFSLHGHAVATVRQPSDPRVVFLRDCAVCHGAGATGTGRGPSLFGTGAASLEYQLTTGRMPLPATNSASRRRAPAYDPATIDALVKYVVGTLGVGGPPVPTVDLSKADVSDGGSIYRSQCAACHQWAGEGGALERRNAPPLHDATPTQIAEAVRTGPATMPVFGEQAMNAAELNDVVAYVRSLDSPKDAGGAPLWHLGPLPEGAVALTALFVLVAVLRKIGTRS